MERSEACSQECNEDEVKLGHIPEWLLLEVLVRLPLKSVFRFKLVSKKWLSVISDPYFVRVYVSRASLSLQCWTIVAFHMRHKDYQFSHLDYELLNDLCVKPSLCVVSVPSVHQPQEDENYLICGVSNGLVFYRRYMGGAYVNHYYYVCNPLTGQSITLPPLACSFNWCGWGFHTHVEDNFLKSCRVVRVEPPIRGSNRLKFQVYVSEIGEWKDFIVPCNLFPLYTKKAAVVLDGILHWIAKEHGIIAYDPYQNPENVRIIAFPGDFVGPNEFNGLCVEYGGKLRYFKVGGLFMSGVAFSSFEVWVLNDYNSGDWCLQHNMSHEDVQYDAKFSSRRISTGSVCFHPFDSDTVYLEGDGVCVSCNLETRKLQVKDEFFRHSKNVSKKWSQWCAPSYLFVIPHWPISIPRPSRGAIKS